MTKEESVAIVKSQFISISGGVLMSALCSYLPFFKIPPFNKIAELVINKATTKLASAAETGAFFVYINFNVDAQGRNFMSAAIKNHNAQINGSIEEKVIAEENLKDAFRKLIRLPS